MLGALRLAPTCFCLSHLLPLSWDGFLATWCLGHPCPLSVQVATDRTAWLGGSPRFAIAFSLAGGLDVGTWVDSVRTRMRSLGGEQQWVLWSIPFQVLPSAHEGTECALGGGCSP